MTAREQLLHIAATYRRRAELIPEEATRLLYDPAPAVREVLEKAELYEACAADVAGMPEDQAADVAKRFRIAMWIRDEAVDDEPSDFHP